MRCHYLSDLHLESQSFDLPLPKGDVLILAGDLSHARCLDPARTDRYSIDQRARTLRFIEAALRNFAHVLLIAGNHDHYDGVFEDTAGLMRRQLAGVTVLDGEATEIDGVRFFGATLWTDLGGLSAAEVTAVRKGMGEYFFVKTRGAGTGQQLARRRPRTHNARTRPRGPSCARPLGPRTGRRS